MLIMNPPEITVTVRPQYLPEQSDPENQQFAFSYTVTIRNNGSAGVQLIARHWFITDGEGEVQEGKGLGAKVWASWGSNLYCALGSILNTPVGQLYPPQPALCGVSIFVSPRTHSSFRPIFLSLPWSCLEPCINTSNI